MMMLENREHLGGSGQQALFKSAPLLVVDDDEQLARLYQMILTGAGYSVSLARDGAQCLEMYRQALAERPYALVMLDMAMPGMNGLECLKRLRGLDENVRVLISSGSCEYDLDSLADQVAGIVPKPSSMAKLLESVEGVLSAANPRPGR